MLANITQLATSEGRSRPGHLTRSATLLSLLWAKPRPKTAGQVGGGGRAMDPYVLTGVTQLSMTGMTACQQSHLHPWTQLSDAQCTCWFSQVSFPELGGHILCHICNFSVGFFWAQGWNHHPSQFIPCANQLSLLMALEGGGAPQRDRAFEQALHLGPSEGVISGAEPCWNRQLGLCTLRRGCLAVRCPMGLELSWHLWCSAFSISAAVLYLGWGGLGLCMWLWYLAGF